jgi:hypothetical protein
MSNLFLGLKSTSRICGFAGELDTAELDHMEGGNGGDPESIPVCSTMMAVGNMIPHLIFFFQTGTWGCPPGEAASAEARRPSQFLKVTFFCHKKSNNYLN